MNIPQALKPFKHYMLQALQLSKLKQPEPELMSIYCLIAFVQKGYPLMGDDAEIKSLLMELMDDIAKKKKDPLVSELFQEYKQKEPEFIKRFATTIWKRADNTDRAGRATRQTAKAFFASSIFFQCLDQYDCPEDVEEVQPLVKYAKFKTNDILKAIKAGRKPTPGPPGGESAPTVGGDDGANEKSDLGNSQADTNDSGAKPVAPVNLVQPTYNNQPVVAGTMGSFQNTFVNGSFPSNFSPQRVRNGSVEDALELARYAVASLEEEDKERAAMFLQNALNALTKNYQ